jgi:hypothetical protein
MNWNFINIFWKNNKIIIFMKISLVGAEFFYKGGQTEGQTDGRTDMTKQIVAFCTSAKRALKLLNN